MIDIRSFTRSESGAMSADWVVLSALSIGLGTMTIMSLSTGPTSMAAQIGGILANVNVAGTSAAAFLYTWYDEATQDYFLGVYRGLTDAELVNESKYYSDAFRDQITSGNIADPQHLIEQRHMIQTVLDERDVQAHGDALSVSEMQQMLAEAQGE